MPYRFPFPFALCLIGAAAALNGCVESSSPVATELPAAAATGSKPSFPDYPKTLFPKAGDLIFWTELATGTGPITYKWQKCLNGNGPSCVDMPGQTTNSLFLIAHADNKYQHCCLATNAFGTTAQDMSLYFADPLVCQAEAAQISGGSSHAMNPLNPLSNRYVFFHQQSGGSIILKPAPKSADVYNVEFTYSNASPPSSMKIEVNGVVVKSALAFPATATWDTWATVKFPVNLKSGTNTLKATVLNWGGPHLDKLSVY